MGAPVDGWNSREIPRRVAERAHNRHRVDEGGCWISTYSTQSAGYAQVGWKVAGRTFMVLAHRASWEYANGRVPEGSTIDHLCKQRRCVNPQHMRLLSNFENARRTHGREWGLGECVNGHSNVHLRKYAAQWGCSLCRAEYQRRYRARKAAGLV